MLLLLLLLFGSPQWGWCIKSFCKICPWTWRWSSLPLFTETNWKQNLLQFWGTLLSLDANCSIGSSASPLLDLFASSPSCVHRARPVTAGSDCGEKTIPTKSNQDGCTMQIPYFGPIKQRLVKTNTTYTYKIFDLVWLEVGGSLNHYFLRRTSICRIF